MSLGGCVRVWVAILALEVLLTLAFASPRRLQDVAEAEFVRSKGVLGDARAERVAVTAVALGASIFGMLGHDKSDVEVWQPSRRGLDLLRERGQHLLLLMFLRAGSWGHVIHVIVACLIAAAVDGLMVRRRRAFTLETTNTALYNVAAYLLICATMAPLACLVAPTPLPVGTLVALGLALMIALWILCAHLPGPATLVARYPGS